MFLKSQHPVEIICSYVLKINDDNNHWKTSPGGLIILKISVYTSGVLLTAILIIINARVVKLQSFSTGADSDGRRSKLG